MDTLVKRILTTKLWPEGAICQGTAVAATPEARPWRISVTELGGEVLCGRSASTHNSVAIYPVRQDERNQTRLSHGHGRRASAAILPSLFGQAAQCLCTRKNSRCVAAPYHADGQFGAMMDVSLVNDGTYDAAETRSRNDQYVLSAHYQLSIQQTKGHRAHSPWVCVRVVGAPAYATTRRAGVPVQYREAALQGPGYL